MIEIKHLFSNATICSFDVSTIREDSEQGKNNLSGADLYGANLSGAYLSGADLSGADLYGAYLDGEKLTKSPLTISGLNYWCLITDGYMRIGCKRFTHDEWSEFSDEQIEEMDSHALTFWKQWKDHLLSMCESHKKVIQ